MSNIEEVWGTLLDDTLVGDGFDNFFSSGSGVDTLTGGGGADKFETKAGDVGVDIITDFTAIEDELHLANLLDAAFTLGTSSNYVQATFAGGDTTFSVDADGALNGANYIDVATLTGVAQFSVLTYVYDDADNTTTVTVM